jgi:hypothetical protein
MSNTTLNNGITIMLSRHIQIKHNRKKTPLSKNGIKKPDFVN